MVILSKRRRLGTFISWVSEQEGGEAIVFWQVTRVGVMYKQLALFGLFFLFLLEEINFSYSFLHIYVYWLGSNLAYYRSIK